jgi:hypothetical protein
MGNHHANMNPHKHSYYSVEYLNGEFSLDNFTNPHLTSGGGGHHLHDRPLINPIKPTPRLSSSETTTTNEDEEDDDDDDDEDDSSFRRRRKEVNHNRHINHHHHHLEDDDLTYSSTSASEEQPNVIDSPSSLSENNNYNSKNLNQYQSVDNLAQNQVDIDSVIYRLRRVINTQLTISMRSNFYFLPFLDQNFEKMTKIRVLFPKDN